MSSSKKYPFISQALDERRVEHRFRDLNALEIESDPLFGKREGKTLLNFCSNDYLGLSNNPVVKQRSVEFVQKYGAGSSSSRLVSGTRDYHSDLEKKFAKVCGFDSVLLFNTGFQANLSIIAAIADRNSLILADKKSHNSLIQGAQLSKAEFKRFNHNDYNQLEKFLIEAQSKNYNRIWIISETIFSMDGDANNLEELVRLSSKYKAYLYSDDAHALGVFGYKGMGFNPPHKEIDLNIGTFGKAFGSFGAFVGCAEEMKDYLVNFCSGFIYTTALPPAIIGALDAALDLIPTMDEERTHILKLSEILRHEMHKLGFDTANSISQIVPIIVGSDKNAVSLSNHLESKGILASAIRPPTVEKDKARIRITITANHQQKHIEQLVEVIREWKNG